MKRHLKINQIPIFMSLGCSTSEQAQKQKVLVSLTMNFQNYAQAETSDQLEHSICYASIAEKIEAVCLEKSYHLIEHACFSIYTSLKRLYPNSKIKLEFHKVSPPHHLLENGTTYSIEDEDV